MRRSLPSQEHGQTGIAYFVLEGADCDAQCPAASAPNVNTNGWPCALATQLVARFATVPRAIKAPMRGQSKTSTSPS